MVNFSRVHISRAVYDNLKGAFEVEPGNGRDRDSFLAEYKIETFLIVGKAKSVSGRSGSLVNEKSAAQQIQPISLPPAIAATTVRHF